MDEHENARLGVYENDERAMTENDDSEFDDENEDDIDSLSPDMNSALTELASKLCAICQNLCQSGVLVVKYWEHSGAHHTRELEHHPSLSSLRESVNGGCPLCMEITRSFEERLDIQPEIRDAVADSWYTTCRLIRKEWSSKVDGPRFLFTFYDSDGEPANSMLGENIDISFFPTKNLVVGPEYLEYSAGATNAKFTPKIDLAQRWFATCLDTHDCRAEGPPKVLPARLIEVRTHGGTSFDTIARLCEAEDFSADVSYLTLSHCWGSDPIFTLTTENLETLKRDIPIHQLPPLFKDALHMTRELGIKYIWIDCLCILQDCQDDWVSEAAKMGDVYRFAKCNIAGSGYKNGKTGFFRERTPLPLLNYPLYLDLVLVEVGDSIGYTKRKPFKGIYVRGDKSEFDDAVTRGPLNSRAWVAQERALSPAILHFTPKQMWWECRGRIASEAFPSIHIGWDLIPQEEDTIGPKALRSLSTKSDTEKVYESWIDFVSFYAGTDITFESDRLPALNGIARAYGEFTKDNLIAGFWEGNLICSLAWSVLDQHRAKKIPCTQRAPSWSWAYLCLPHEPAFIFPGFTLYMCICRRVLSDDPGFTSDLHSTSFKKSAVQGLEINGPLRRLPATMTRLSELSKLSEWSDCVERMDVFYDMADSRFFSAEDIANPEHTWHWNEPRHILPLIIVGSRHVSCLLLNQVPGAEHSNVFRRLGMVHIYVEDYDSLGEMLGLEDKNGMCKRSTVFEDFGFHDLILI